MLELPPGRSMSCVANCNIAPECSLGGNDEFVAGNCKAVLELPLGGNNECCVLDGIGLGAACGIVFSNKSAGRPSTLRISAG